MPANDSWVGLSPAEAGAPIEKSAVRAYRRWRHLGRDRISIREVPMDRRPPSLVWLVLGVAALTSAQGIRENVRVGLVTVRLDVRGGDGRPLQDLKASEVRLRVDGREVAIEGLDRIGAAGP